MQGVEHEVIRASREMIAWLWLRGGRGRRELKSRIHGAESMRLMEMKLPARSGSLGEGSSGGIKVQQTGKRSYEQ